MNLSNDMRTILEILALNYFDPSEYLVSEERGNGIFIGLPYKKIMEKSQLSFEKTLLSLGGLEAKGLIEHIPAVQRQTINYHGRSNVEIAGQKIVRIFRLSSLGREMIKGMAIGSNLNSSS
ncbi:MAG: hypothetical protein ACFFFG_02085 [Candidatus Thorarchaeota archaeon]